MKRMLIAAAALTLAVGGEAFAADLPPPVAPPPQAPATYVPMAAPVFSWSGFYLGVNLGYGFGTVSPTGAASFSTNGFLAGGTVGANYQMGGFVLGIEGDVDYDSLNTTMPGGGSFKSSWLSTVRGRAGWAWDRILFYGTGGGAFAPAAVPGASTNMFGWTAGAGIEAAVTPNWTARIEYLYVDFPSPSLGTPAVSFSYTSNLVRAGVDYKFSW